MAENETGKPPRKHLHSAEATAAAAAAGLPEHPSRRHRQSNGLRVHGIYFIAVSLVALVVVVVFIAIASAM